MKKGIYLLLLLLLPINVMAASGSIKPSVSSTKVTLNNTVSVTVKVSSSDTLGSWQFNVSYDSSKLTLTSGDTSVVGYGDGTYKSKSYTYKFRAIATGNAKISVDNARIVDWDSESKIDTSGGSVTLSIKEPVIIKYSSDNNLKSLGVEGFNLSPEFDKSVLDYSVTVKSDTTKVKINADKNDSKAKISGTGEKDVVEGSNPFEIVVTAENGTSKTYKLTVVVPEKDPIKYDFGGVEYSILRKLPESVPVNFSTSTIKINDEDVACLQNETLNLTLIYLRDKDNHEGFYIYNDSNKTTKKYNEIKSNDISIYLSEATKPLDNLTKTSLELNGVKVDAYQIQPKSKDYILYGRDVSTGKENYYVYDTDMRSLVLFNQSDFNYLFNHDYIYKIISLVLAGLIILLFIILLISANTKKKLSAMIIKLEEEKQEIKPEKVKNKKQKEKNLE